MGMFGIWAEIGQETSQRMKGPRCRRKVPSLKGAVLKGNFLDKPLSDAHKPSPGCH